MSVTRPKLSSATRLCLSCFFGLEACLSTVAPLPEIGYHNPLDLLDGGPIASDGGVPDAGNPNSSKGTVDGRSPDLSAAIYLVTGLDGGQPRTQITLGDVANLCAFSRTSPGDGGALTSYDLVQLRLAGDVAGTYLVSLALSPSGATAALQYRSDAGAFGTAQAVSGIIELNGVDPRNQQPAEGLYTLTFSATETLSGRFLAEPCAGLAPPAGGT